MKNKVLLIISCLLSISLSAQQIAYQNFKTDISDVELDIQKLGPYIGYQQGKYTSVELGLEFQHKNVKLIKPTTYSLHAGFNYNFSDNLFGLDVGYWYKQGRLNLTYGINGIFRTDYKVNAVGIAPVMGYKLGQFHFQAGYNFLTRDTKVFPCNTFFVTIRLVIVQNRNYIWKK